MCQTMQQFGSLVRKICNAFPYFRDGRLRNWASVVKFVSPFLLVAFVAMCIHRTFTGDCGSTCIKDMEVVVIDGTEYSWLKRPRSDAPNVISARDGSAVFNLLNTLSKNTETVNSAFQKAHNGLRHHPNLQLDLLKLAESVSSLNFQSLCAFKAFVPASKELLDDLEGACWFLYYGEKNSVRKWLTSVYKGTQLVINNTKLIEERFDSIWLMFKTIQETISNKTLSLNQNLTEIREKMEEKKAVIGSVASEEVLARMNLLFNNSRESAQSFLQRLMSFFIHFFTKPESTEKAYTFMDNDEGFQDGDYQEVMKKILQNSTLVQAINDLNTLGRKSVEMTNAIPELKLAAEGIRAISIAMKDTNALMVQLRDDVRASQEEMKRQFQAMLGSSSAKLESLHADPFKVKIVGFYSKWVAMGTIFHEASRLFKSTKESLDTWIKGVLPGKEVHENAYLIEHVKI